MNFSKEMEVLVGDVITFLKNSCECLEIERKRGYNILFVISEEKNRIQVFFTFVL